MIKIFLCIILLLVFVYLLFTKIFRYNISDLKDPVMYIGEKDHIEEDVYHPLYDQKVKLLIDLNRQKDFIRIVNEYLNQFEKSYSFINRSKLKISSFKIKHFDRIFGTRISEYYIACNILNDLFNYCNKYNCIELFYKVFLDFLNIFFPIHNRDEEIDINYDTFETFRNKSKNIMIYIIVNWMY